MLKATYFKDLTKKFFLNSYCLSCNSIHTEDFYHVCSKCSSVVPLVKEQNNLCPLCHDTWVVDGICENCNNQPPLWEELHTVFCYKDTLKDLFHLYKFQDSMLAEKDLVRLLTPHIQSFEDCHFVVVPCSKLTRQRLGFNPVTKILQQITDNYSEPFDNMSTFTIKSLGREGRKNAQSNITFDIDRLKQKHNLILVDDIFTTGSTLTRVGTLLKNHNINYFDALCFFRS